MSALLPKPRMRGLLNRRLKFHLAGLLLFSGGFAAWHKFGVSEPRKRAYEEFYKNYDAVKEFEAMRETGVFESVQPTKP
uniref:Cytochrome c oxidase subunit 6C n=1 Tax=Sphenodon punctatus TaxID=8508 RepID=A0A8D0L3M3_SPHPU